MSDDKNTIDLVVHLLKQFSKKMSIDPSTINWNMFSSYASKELQRNGVSFDNTFKKLMTDAGGFNNIRDSHFKRRPNPEKLDIVQIARHNRKIENYESSSELFLSKLDVTIQKYFSKPILMSNVKPPKAKTLDRAVFPVISDVHLGAVLDPKEVNANYGILEQCRRMAKIALETADFKPQYREHTRLSVNLIGDIIQGLLHSFYEGIDEADQFCLAVWILSQFIGYLASNYPIVDVHCVSGNHDRIKSVHEERAVHKKWNSEATKIYYAVKTAVLASGFKNVNFFIYKTPWINYSLLGHNYWATHGDNVIKVGYLNASINTKMLENEVNKINAGNTKYDVVFLGHVHFGTQLRFGNGVTLLTNPALIPPDAYANSIGIFGAQTGQWLFEATKEYSLGDSRFLMVDEKTDKDTSLDKVIKPYIDFNVT